MDSPISGEHRVTVQREIDRMTVCYNLKCSWDPNKESDRPAVYISTDHDAVSQAQLAKMWADL
jgi:hypothetical protein